jgi:hypothetical protein
MERFFFDTWVVVANVVLSLQELAMRELSG